MKKFVDRPIGLAIVAFLGLVLAILGALQPVSSSADEAGSESSVRQGDILARVGDRNIVVDDLLAAARQEAAVRRGRPDEAELRALLESLIDEELLIQRASTLGLLETDPTLRRAMETAMKQRVADRVPLPTEEQLRLFFEQHREAYGDDPFEQAQRRVLRDQQKQARERAVAAHLADLRASAGIWRADNGSGERP